MNVVNFLKKSIRRVLRSMMTTPGILCIGVVLLALAMLLPSSGASEISVPEAAVLGAVEGLTEYLPVSSTGHLILASHALGLSEFGSRSGLIGRDVVKSPAVSAFEITIQIGAILAVLGLYRRRVGQMTKGLLGRDAQGRRLLQMLLVGASPALLAGLLLHKPIQENLFGPLTVSAALIAGGLLMIVVELFRRRRTQDSCADIDRMAYWQALVIGLAQILALWPGTSRSMVTILAAILVGMDRVSAAEFSFLLALPTLGAATVFEAVCNAQGLMGQIGMDVFLVGVASSAIVAVIAVKLFIQWLNRHGLAPFGVYRVLLGAAVLWYFRSFLV